jgi:hypothetical protein
MISDAEHFHLDAELEAFEAERRIYRRAWSSSVPRA